MGYKSEDIRSVNTVFHFSETRHKINAQGKKLVLKKEKCSCQSRGMAVKLVKNVFKKIINYKNCSVYFNHQCFQHSTSISLNGVRDNLLCI